LVLILAGLAGSLGLIVAIHRRSSVAKKTPPVVVAAIPSPAPKPLPPAPPLAEPDAAVEEAEPPPPPQPEDSTPKALARLTSAEAEQLLEASKADRKAEALERARKAALLESEKWRRREALVRLQLDSLDTKARTLEAQADELALERDALEQEKDARKAMAAQAQSRPSQAILPHRGQNGTWRRPIVVECSNGMATLQPQGVGFGLLELASGFGPASNPFVAAIAREAIRIQMSHQSPDGQAVVPYIFFLVRPDGIRAYYEARGRLEPLGISFGYELADQDWQVDFPDLDDVATWDGSPSSRPDPVTRPPARPSGAASAEDADFPDWRGTRGNPRALRDDGPGGEFTWPPRTANPARGGRAPLVLPGFPPGGRTGSRAGDATGTRRSGTSEGPGGIVAGSTGGDGELPGMGAGETPEAGVAGGPGPGPGQGSTYASAPRELSLGDGPVTPLPPAQPGPSSSGVSPAPASREPDSTTLGVEPPGEDPTASSRSFARDDPANKYVWPAPPVAGGSSSSRKRIAPEPGGDPGDGSPPTRHVGPFSRPLAGGLDSLGLTDPPVGPTSDDPTQSGNAPMTASDSSARPQGTTGAAAPPNGGSQGDRPGPPPPPGSIGVEMPGMPSDVTPPPGMTPPPGIKPPAGRPKPTTDRTVPPTSIVDRRFEIVVVCGPRGVIVQPGAYRVTTDALKDRDGLLKKQIVALVKARRSADPSTTIEPRVRFLVQPGGDANYWTARSQFLLSGLDWPLSTQVAEGGHTNFFPSEGW
jgi:hypothetical protein